MSIINRNLSTLVLRIGGLIESLLSRDSKIEAIRCFFINVGDRVMTAIGL